MDQGHPRCSRAATSPQAWASWEVADEGISARIIGILLEIHGNWWRFHGKLMGSSWDFDGNWCRFNGNVMENDGDSMVIEWKS